MSDPRDEDPAQIVGQVLLDGKLEVVRLLGAGGMGAVYEVVHRMTRHHRALKVLHAEYAQRSEVVARFLREASVAGTLRTRHVVETYDAGQLADGSPYVLMEMLEGESLAEALERGPMPPQQIAEIVWEACEGLTVAHAAGIVHRDVKPDNLFLARDQDGQTQVKLLDFGISKFGRGHDFAGTLTGDGQMMGTPFYMSPEQAQGAKDVDARADVYALGVILYEALTGRPPFMAESLPALVVQIYEGAFEPLAKVAPDVPPDLAAVVERAMHRDVETRYQDTHQLQEALRPHAGGDLPERISHAVAFEATMAAEPVASTSPPRTMAAPTPGPVSEMPSSAASAPRPPWVAIGAAALLAIGAGVAWFALSPSESGEAASSEVQPTHAGSEPAGAASSSPPAGMDAPTRMEASGDAEGTAPRSAGAATNGTSPPESGDSPSTAPPETAPEDTAPEDGPPVVDADGRHGAAGASDGRPGTAVQQPGPGRPRGRRQPAHDPGSASGQSDQRRPGRGDNTSDAPQIDRENPFKS